MRSRLVCGTQMVMRNFYLLMKFRKTALVALTLLTVMLTFAGAVFAFHNGGVGPCDACHSMHNGSDLSSKSLLIASDASSVCLNCHERAGAVGPTYFFVSTASSDLLPGLPPRQITPGGDFGWLKKDYFWVPDATQAPLYSHGERHGHNITAADYSYMADVTNLTAPEGTYPSTSLACISCHDPHGQYRRNVDGTITTSGSAIQSSGSYASSPDPQIGYSVGVYRMLGGENYQPKSLPGSIPFTYDPPAAVAPDVYNRSEAVTQTRVAYGSGMSEWCQNCHTTMHKIFSSPTSTTATIHPVGSIAKLGFTDSGNYNAYLKTGDLTGISTMSYLSLVPFEEGTASYAVLKSHAKNDDSYLVGPDSVNAQVMCLTCHRAHASGWDGATRWNTTTDFIVSNGLYAQQGQPYQPYGQGRTELEAQMAYDGITESRFALNQDTLCHKCHTGVLP